MVTILSFDPMKSENRELDSRTQYDILGTCPIDSATQWYQPPPPWKNRDQLLHSQQQQQPQQQLYLHPKLN